MTRRPLSPAMIRGLAALAQAENGTLSDESLRVAIGHHATNVILSLQDRRLVRRSEGLFADDGDDMWTLTSRGSLAWAAVQTKDRPACCSKCGQLLPASLSLPDSPTAQAKPRTSARAERIAAQRRTENAL